jgi:predicted glycosyltransferase
MIWIDISTPKCVMFFAEIIKVLKKFNYEILVTTRFSIDYNETQKLLDLYKIKYYNVGRFGGKDIKDKFKARLKRNEEFLELFERIGYPKILLNWAVSDAVQVAFGLGIKIITFNDTPIALQPNYKQIHNDLTPVSRLTIPFSDIVFYPFVLPKELFNCAKRAISYDFIDVCLWMKDIKKDEKNDFRKRFNIPTNKPTILIREEEYKAHYVKDKKPFIYKLIKKLQYEDFSIVIIPRYESEYLKKDFPFAYVIEDRLKPQEFYPFIDFFVGGGGTMTLEAVYYGIPTISMRSIWLIHDKYLIDNGLMFWTNDVNKAFEYIKQNIGKKFDNKRFFCKGECSLENIANIIKDEYENIKISN